ncbi:hypothetical protein O6H91_17G044900 [Diphasiastrum complanatum]|uniref:Uncharacterized protein n=1 Tax=Diphasiastrum complanatum TaxID=34168 RepID=A0ACC2B6C8_DIPCM|nr:hypothetical protein O6H91_17G044900 [Diphasiastrum complanatum]
MFGQNSNNMQKESPAKSSFKDKNADLLGSVTACLKLPQVHISQQELQSVSRRPAHALNDLKSLVPFGTAQQQALHQQALHQQALHQQALQQHGIPKTAYHHMPAQSSYTPHLSKVQPSSTSNQQSISQQSGQQVSASHIQGEVVKSEQTESDSISLKRESIDMENKRESRGEMKFSSMKLVPEVGGTEQFERHHEERGATLLPQGGPIARTVREVVFADLNAEPPASDGEDEGLPVMDDTVDIPQAPCNSKTLDESKDSTDFVKEQTSVKEGEEKNPKSGKCRPKPKGDTALDSGQEGDMELPAGGAPSSKEEKIKSLKVGLIHVGRKLPKNAHAHFALGIMHQRLGQLLKATTAFEKAVEILKQSEEEATHGRTLLLGMVQSHIAQCLLQGNISCFLVSNKELQTNDMEVIINKLKMATSTNFGHAPLWNTLGLLLLRTGRIKTAISVFKSLLGIVPEYLEALANLGVAYLHNGDLQHSSRCLQAVLEKDASHPGALINYGVLLLRQYASSLTGPGAGAGVGAYALQFAAAAAAQQCLGAALREDPKAGYIWANLAAAYEALGDLCSTRRCLEQAAKLEPARLSTRYTVAAHRARDAERSDDPAEQLEWAANEMASVLREGDPATVPPRLAWAGLALVNRAQRQIAAGFVEEGVDLKEVEERAAHTLQQAIEEDPDDTVAWHQLGLHSLCTLQFEAAMKFLKIAIAKRQTFAHAWSNLGISLQLSDNGSLAEDVYKQALILTAPEQAHAIFSNLGNLYRQQRRFIDARAAFARALELCPDYAPALNNLGLLLIAEGQWDEAISTFDHALVADPYLDAAKSNKMKAVALVNIQKGFPSSFLTQTEPFSSVATNSTNIVDRVAPLDASTPASTYQGPMPRIPPQREPFPLPSIS